MRCSRFIAASRAARAASNRRRRTARRPRDRQRRAFRPVQKDRPDGSKPVLDDRLERRQSWRDELIAQRLHRAVATARWNHRAGRRTALGREIDRSARPFDRLSCRHERRAEQDEHAQGDVLAMQEVGGPPKRVERHSFVKPREHFWMRGLESNRHFERAAESTPGTCGIARAYAPERNAGCDSTITRSNPSTSRAMASSSSIGICCGSKKLPALYSLMCRAG